jgi:nitrate reductase (cytochrome), electron transfer subunit
MTTATSSSIGPSLQIGFSIVLGMAVIGFFVGIGEPPATGSPLVHKTEAAAAQESGAMPSYSMMRTTARGGSTWSEEVATLNGGASIEDPGTKASALAARSDRRAYDGAPPTIPHPVRQNAAPECLACHEDGLRIRDRLATAMPHAELASCTQCHVVDSAPMPGETLPPDATFAPNAFEGMDSPTQGARAWAIAPPTVPHRTTMRERCMSCHGPNGRDPLQTPHPERRSCSQCHAPSAGLDQAPGGVR